MNFITKFLTFFLKSNENNNDNIDKNNDDENNDDDIYDCFYEYTQYEEHEIEQISQDIYRNIQNINDPTFEEINKILIATNYFLKNDKIAYKELILKCPYKFMITYANNSERTPQIVNYVKTFDTKLANKILEYTNNTHKNTWNERRVFY